MASPLGQFLLRQIEGRLGVSVVPTEEVQALQEQGAEFAAFREEASELAYHALDYYSGKPQDMRPEARNRLAQRSRIALMIDPLAGAEGDLRANFAFGRGVPMPDAVDPEVQQAIEEAWTDPNNAEKLTSFEAQQHRSRELLAQANLYPTAFIKNGRVRVGFLDADTVSHIIPHPEDEERPLWYATRKRRVEWDYKNRRWKTVDELGEDGKPKLVYHQHWRNVEDADAEAKANGVPAPEKPPAAEQGEGFVLHVRINRIGRTFFGTPPFARTLRFYSAMNELTEAHIAVAQASATFIAKRTRISAPSDLTKSANAILAQTGEIAATSFGSGEFAHGGRGQLPPAPGSFWMENPSDKLEALDIGQRGGEAQAISQVVRAPISAASGFQQGYLGDAQNAGSLAAATALELPTLMNIQSWQETGEGMLRWFVDLVIREAVRAGRLGDNAANSTMDKSLAELQLQEADQRREAENRTGKDLSYAITSPYPGRRNLPDVTTTVSGVLTAVPGGGRSKVLVGEMLTFLFVHGMQLENPKEKVEEIIAELETVWQQMDLQAQAQVNIKAGLGPDGKPLPGASGSGGGAPTSTGGSGDGSGGSETSPGTATGAGGSAATGDMGSVAAALAEAFPDEESIGAMFEETVEVPVLIGANGAGRNGG